MGAERILIIEDDLEIQDAKTKAQREAVSIDERQRGKSPRDGYSYINGGFTLVNLAGEMKLR